MRETIRKILIYLFLSVFTVILIAVLGEWFIEVAKDKGLYKNAGDKWDSIMKLITSFMFSHYFLYPLTLLIGFYLGVLVYWLAGKFDMKDSPKTESIKSKMNEFCADYEKNKPNFHGVSKSVYLSQSESHEKLFKERFMREILPLIENSNISIPEYKVTQRRWEEICLDISKS